MLNEMMFSEPVSVWNINLSMPIIGLLDLDITYEISLS